MTNRPVAVFVADNGNGPELWRTDGTAGGTFALTTVDPGPLAFVGGVAYFLAPDGNGSFGPQYQLWRTDGTVAGTYALGISNGSINAPPDITELGGKIFYIGADATHREALFETDGVHQGTFVAALNSDPNAAFNASFVGAVGGNLLIEVSNALWVSDGTSGGTHLLGDGEAGSSLSFASAPVIVNGEAFFTADDGVHGVQFWETNGGVATSVALPAAGNLNSRILKAGADFIFAMSTGVGTTVYSWDGVSANATVLVDAVSISNLKVVNGVASFTAFLSNGTEPFYLSDGTQSGTHFIAGGSIQAYAQVGGAYLLNDGQNILLATSPQSISVISGGANNLTSFVQVGARVFFVTNNSQLWVSDGTMAGTHLVRDQLSNPSNLAAMGGELVFSTSTDGSNTEPWVSDGTTGGTHVITNIHPTNPGSLTIVDEGGFGGDLVFLGSTATTGPTVWVSDGTVNGTGVLEIPLQPGNFALFPPLVSSGGQLFFTVATANGDQLWVANSAIPGSAASPIAGSILNPNSAFMTAFDGGVFYYSVNAGGTFFTDGTGPSPTLLSSATVLAQPVQFNNELLFFGSTMANGTGLFETDGTAAGANFIGDVPAAVTASSFTVSGSQVFFVAGDASTGAELWVTDGTAQGTHIVEDIAPGAAGSAPTQLTAFDGGVVFTANDQTHGEQIWFSNGNPADTFFLGINLTHSAAASLVTSQIVQFGGKAYFIANDGAHGDQLWSSDGTAGGTSVVAQLSLTASVEQGFDFTILNGKLFFVDAGVPWISDGTAAGTTQVTFGNNFLDVNSTPVVVNGLMYFEADISTGNPHLFVTDGTSAGTHDIGGGDLAGQVPGFAVGGDNLYFTDGFGGLYDYDTLTGVETQLAMIPQTAAFGINVGGQIGVGTPGTIGNSSVWVTDGTAAGTVEVAQAASTTYTDYTSLGGKLYFLAYGPSSGLWVTNGTLAGTHQISSLSIQSQTLTPIGSNLFFIATQSNVTSGWIYNTTTQTAAAISAPAVKSVPIFVTPAGTGAFFIADDATSQGELWHTTSTGQVVELTSPTNGEVQGPNAPQVSLAVSGSNLLFSGADSVHGQGLFISNGTTTTFLAQVTNPSDFSVIGGSLYFQGTDATNGAELWVSNGTAAGTHRVTDTQTPGSANRAASSCWARNLLQRHRRRSRPGAVDAAGRRRGGDGRHQPRRGQFQPDRPDGDGRGRLLRRQRSRRIPTLALGRDGGRDRGDHHGKQRRQSAGADGRRRRAVLLRL